MNKASVQVFDSLEATGADQEHWPTIQRWLDRGDGVAVYQNMAMDHSQFGHHQFVSFGSSDAQLETDTPPERLPDIGNRINWPYRLIGIYRPSMNGRGQSDAD